MKELLILICALIATSQGATLGNFNTKIVNGERVLPGERPFQVSLQTASSFHFCGGSIINEYYIVTAAHCVDSKQPEDVFVAVGTIYYKQPSQKVGAKKLIVHEKYSYVASENDIALIKVDQRIKFDESTQPIELTEQSAHVPTHASVVVSGWGRMGFAANEKPDYLLKAEIQVADPEFCKSVMEEVGSDIYPTNICAYDPNMRRGQCNGDSGGPLTYEGKLVGIVSWSIKDPYCASTKYPGVYTRATEYVDWIEEHIDEF